MASAIPSRSEQKQDISVHIGINEEAPPPAYGASEPAAGSSTAEIPPPPSYEEAAKDAPPSYNALFGQMQDARRESTNPFDYVRKVVKLMLNTACVTIFMLVVLAIPISMITIGSIYIHDCPVQEKIPIFLIAMGCVYIVKNLADLRKRWINRHEEQSEMRSQNYEDFGSRLLGCAIIFFFIAGNVWIYSVYPIVTTENPLDDRYCNPVLYYFAFWLLTIVYIVCALTCCCICCTAGAAATSPSPSPLQE